MAKQQLTVKIRGGGASIDVVKSITFMEFGSDVTVTKLNGFIENYNAVYGSSTTLAKCTWYPENAGKQLYPEVLP